MYAAVESRFADALAKGALHFTPSTEVRKTLDSGVDAIYTLAPALLKKPQQGAAAGTDAATDATTAAAAPPAQTSPWLPPDEALLIEKGDKYSLVLNKFALSKYHFLLISNEFQRQTLPLSESDFGAAFDVLRKANRESGKRHIGFFNSGPQSGASIQHKHIQFMTLPDNFRPFPDTTPEVSLEGSAADKRVPFAHYIAGLSRDMPPEDIVLRYSELLGRVLTTVSRANPGRKRPEINYNLVFTEEWLLATPRRKEALDSGISINALGTVGLLVAKSDEQLKALEERGLDAILDLGFPFDDVKEYRPDHTGYTHY